MKSNSHNTPLGKILQNLPKSPEGHWLMAQSPIVISLDKYNIKTMLEIGFNNGYSAAMFLTTLPLEKFYSLDIGIHPFVEEVQQEFKSRYGDAFVPLIEDSMNIRNTPLNDLEFDLVFIDGGHSYEVAHNDMMFAMDKARYILLDDTAGGSPGVSKLVAFLRGSDKLEVIETYKMGSGAVLYKCLK